MSDREGNHQTEISIINDLTNVDYIELLQVEEDREILREVEGIHLPLLICTNNSLDGVNRKEEYVSRKPTQEELNRGYALSIVPYYLNIDRSKAFMSINDLVGKEIKVNNNNKVVITRIDANDKATKISMKIDGSYDYKNLSELVIFDEDMKDTCRWEGHRGAVLENPETKEVSITLGAVDKNKKYTIGIPMTREVKYNEENKIVIKLN